MHLHVAPLSKVEAVARAVRPGRMVSLIHRDPPVPTPEGLAPEHHLHLAVHDIATPMDGYVMASEEHVARLLAFARDWDRSAPMLIHCYAGISRSTAAAFIIACALAPRTFEQDVADHLRAASPSATPNTRLVALADQMLGREGRMVEAIRRIGRGADAFEGAPFMLPVR